MKIVKSSLLTFTPILLLFCLIKTFNPLPEIKNEKKSIFDLSISSDIKVTVYETLPFPPEENIEEDTFSRILRTKTLRVGYTPNAAPFSFTNFDHALVGYNIAFAYELAYDLGCNLELVPMTYSNVSQELTSDAYDIAMSTLSVTEERLKNIVFTEPYMEPEVVFVSLANRKRKFKSLKAIQDNNQISIAVLKGSSYEKLAKEYFPDHPIILLDQYNQFETGHMGDLLLWEEPQAIAWVIQHKQFCMIFPLPSITKDSFAYAIRPNNERFLNYLNQWMHLKTIQGYKERQQKLWIEGKTEIAAQPTPRWSLIRYLGWTE